VIEEICIAYPEAGRVKWNSQWRSALGPVDSESFVDIDSA
jgi:hypothetical protein